MGGSVHVNERSPTCQFMILAPIDAFIETSLGEARVVPGFGGEGENVAGHTPSVVTIDN